MSVTRLKGFNLSMQQAHLWSLQGDQSQTYHAQCAVQLSGLLDSEVLSQAVQWLIDRHSVLRTSFFRVPGMDVPVQIINEHAEVECTFIDIEHLPTEVQELHWQLCFDRMRHEPFDITQYPLLRISVFRLCVDRHVLFISLPSLCADERTLSLLVTELMQAYTLKLRGSSWLEEEEALQYRDIAAWQDELLSEEEAELQRHYWRKIDLTQIATMSLPLAGKGRAESNEALAGAQNDDFSPQVLEIPLDAGLRARLNMRTDQHHSAMSTYLFACWYVTCLKLTNDADVVLGVALDGRFNEELTSALGLYTRFVPITINLADDVPFEQVLLLAKTIIEEAYEKQLYFTWENSSSEAERADGVPYFPLSFEYERWPAAIEGGALTCSLLKRWSCVEPFDLKLSVVQRGEQLSLELHYNPQRVTQAQGHRLAGLFATLLEQVTQQPQSQIGALSLLSAQERTQLVLSSRGPRREWSEQSVQQLFEAQVTQHPNAPAVISRREQWSYQQLNARANQLAQVLRTRGVGAGTVVGLCLEREAVMLVGLLGILKAGGAYLPLDADTPETRLRYQLEESGARWLVTQAGLQEKLPAWAGQTLVLEEVAQEMAEADAQDQVREQDQADALAWVIYTSGSTGKPKGVMVRQSSVVNYTWGMCEQLGAEVGWQYATVSTLAADLGNTAIFCALASGGCVHVLDYETATSGEAMASWAAQHPIDVLKIVPSHLSALLESQRAQEMLPQRALVLGGEALPEGLLQRIGVLGARCVVYNHYGPTETTVGVLVNALGVQGNASSTQAGTVELGRPLANTQVYVLDERMQVVPSGVRGELYIGGAGVGWGYVGQGGQTGERFVPDPYSEQKGGRLYKTGDRGRSWEDGKITFEGRVDGQVKLRGYRIELGEIEAVLRQHPQVRECIVLLRENTVGEPLLVSYTVSKQRVSIAREQLKQWLQPRLPAYMLPTEYVQIDEMPLTANGKVDRERLPRPEQRVLSGAEGSVQPRSPLEEMVAQLWCDLLGIAAPGVYDNFFSLGGHSLLATRVIARLQAMFQVALPVQLLFEAPTVVELSQRIEHILRQSEGSEVPPLVAGTRPAEIPLSFAQQRLWFLDQLQPGSIGYLSASIQRLTGRLNIAAFEQSIGALVQRHESLRTTFVVGAALHDAHVGAALHDARVGAAALHDARVGAALHDARQVIHPVAHVLVPVIDLCGLEREQREAEARILARQEAQRPYDLAQGPLFRLYLLRLELQEHLMLLTLHHIITDGWSTAIVIRELSTLYQAAVTAQPAPLSPLPIQYADYAIWQRQWLQGEVLEAQLAYWREQLAGITPLALSTDYPRPAVQTYRGATVVQMVPVEIIEPLQQLCQQEGVTLFMLLLTAFQILLQRYTGQSDISVGTPIANRTRAEIEGVVGFFVNTLVLRGDLSGDPTFQQALERVRAVCLQAYTHQDIPFEKVVEELEPERDLNRSPLFQVMFSLHEAVAGQRELMGIRSEALEMEHSSSKFDLTLSLFPTPQGLRSILEYRTDLFEATTIQRMLEHWQILLVGIAHDPHAHLSDLPLLTEHERTLLLGATNSIGDESPGELCVHQWFEHQVQHAPDALALVFVGRLPLRGPGSKHESSFPEEQSLTYDALNQRANQVAHHLRSLGIGPDTLVALCMERSIEMVISILGVLKAGGAYVPLDMSTPYERLSMILEDIQAAAILTQEHLRGSLPTEGNTPVICLDTDWKILAEHDATDLACNTSPSHLAYVIYTSGSTGKPKGVLVTHANVAHSTRARFSYYNEPIDSYLLLSPFFFDSSVAGLYWTLCQGGRLVLLQEDFRADLPQLPQFIMQHGISHILSIPSLYAVISSHAQPEQLASLRAVIVAGETCPVSLVQRHHEIAPQADLYNEYGPTEGSVWSSVYQCQRQQLSTQVPIGRPIANVQIYLLDQALHLAPLGVPGELYIGGQGIVRGYLHRADLTAEKFIPHPFVGTGLAPVQPGERLYRTGDLARYRADGNIEFLGRIDQQVKVRGYRIELREIEATLHRHPSVFDCIVLAREYGANDKRLVAYIVLHPEQIGDGEKPSPVNILRTFLQEHLPEYMLPAQMVLLERLPLTANGKVDQKRLPEPDGDGFVSENAFVAPRNTIEEKIIAIWMEILDLPKMSIHDNFFEMGGNSLLATQVIYHMSDAFHMDLQLRVLFEAPTAASFAVMIVQQQAEEVDTELLTQLLAELDQTV